MILLLLKGHPGSGKSTLANHLAHKLHIPVIDKDDARDCLQDFAMQIDTNRLNMASYDIMFRVLTRQLKCGLGGIVDCPLARPEVFAAAQDLGRQFKATMVIVECVIHDLQVWNARLVDRVGDHSSHCSSKEQMQSRCDTSHKPKDVREVQQIIDAYNGQHLWLDILLQEHQGTSSPGTDISCVVTGTTDEATSTTSKPIGFYAVSVDTGEHSPEEACDIVISFLKSHSILIT